MLDAHGMRLSSVIIAIFLSVAVADVHAWSEASETTALEGAVKQPLVLDETLLKSLTPIIVDVTFESAQGKKSDRYTGVLLWTLLEKAEPIDAPGKNAQQSR